MTKRYVLKFDGYLTPEQASILSKATFEVAEFPPEPGLSDEDVERIADAVASKLRSPIVGSVSGPDQEVIWRSAGAWETRRDSPLETADAGTD